MNILRCIDNFDGEGALIDMEYLFEGLEKKIKIVDLRIYAIINNIIGNKLENVSVVEKLVIARELVNWLEKEKTENNEEE
jgi:hypothetical protein